MDHGDLLAVRAPKPVLIVTTTNDFFSIQGARETTTEVSKIYRAYGMSENINKVEDVGGHMSTRKNREALYAFFQKHLDSPGSSEDLDVDILSDEEIRVTETGKVSESPGSETVFSLNRKEAEKRIGELQASRQNLVSHLAGVVESAKKLSGYREPESTGSPVFAGRFQRDGYVIDKHFINGEGDYVIPYLFFRPENSNGKTLIYLHPEGKSAESTEGGEIERFVQNGFTVLAPDLIGTGETRPERSLRMEWRTSILIGRSITGIRAGDVVRLTRLLNEYYDSGNIYAIARGSMSPVLLHAAIFEPSIERIALLEPYPSYRSIVMNRFYHPEYIESAVGGALTAYDLPDLAASQAPRKLLIAGLMDGAGNSADLNQFENDVTVIRRAYQERGAEDQLIISGTVPNIEILNLLEPWMND